MPSRIAPTSGPTAPIRVASVPASHVYVRHLSDPDSADGVERLPDVKPADGAKVPGGWWPPLMLDADWIADNGTEFDVFHVHFGFDAKSLTELKDALDALHDVGSPLVFTLHDLRNPHHADTERHDAQLDLLVEHSSELVTLTAGAARTIASRWDRQPHVLPHPHVVERDRLQAPRARGDDFVVGVHAKSVRANMDVYPVVAVLADVLADLPGTRLRVDLHDEVSSAASYWYAPDEVARLRALADGAEHVELREHPYFTDAELWDYLRAIDVSVLPYRFGTHSGWLEACFDLGTTVVAPDCGFYADQRPCLTYRHDERGLDAASLARAIRLAHGLRPRWRATVEGRMRERRAVAHRHRVLYERLLACT